MPRSRVVIAGVSMSHMPVSLISARSAASSSLLAARKGSRLGLPTSSSPSISTVMCAGMLARGLLPGAQRLDEHHRLALVVHRAARDEALAVRAIDELRLERRAVPELQRIDRLHVVVAVEQDVRSLVAGRRRHDARRRRDGRRSAAPRRGSPSPASWSRTHSAARRQSCRWSGCALIEGMRSRSNSRPREASSEASAWRRTAATVSGDGAGMVVLRLGPRTMPRDAGRSIGPSAHTVRGSRWRGDRLIAPLAPAPRGSRRIIRARRGRSPLNASANAR